MKRTLLAIAIPALLVAASANASIEVWNKDGNKVDFNGRVKAMNRVTDRDQLKEGDKTEARLGMTGSTQIADGLTGYGRWEYQTKTGKDSWDETRYAFAGLNFGDFGAFDYGRNDGVLKAISAYTDVLPEFGGDAGNNNLNVLSYRTKAVATYRNNNFFGLTDDVSFALQYADNGDNSSTEDGKRADSREAYGALLQWKIFDTGLTAGAGYAQTTGDKDKANTWTSGVKYDNYNLYLAANYFQSRLKNHTESYLEQDPLTGAVSSETTDPFDAKIKGIELVAQYGIDLEVGRLTPSLAYIQQKMKDNDGDSSYLTKYVSLGATYAFNKNISALIEYKFNLLDKDDIGAYKNLARVNKFDADGDAITKPGTKDVLGIGLIYQF
ncbi:porin [Orbaceae bacterium ESL0727]|nr:porin [Orbaceae bacterium ESL0727]